MLLSHKDGSLACLHHGQSANLYCRLPVLIIPCFLIKMLPLHHLVLLQIQPFDHLLFHLAFARLLYWDFPSTPLRDHSTSPLLSRQKASLADLRELLPLQEASKEPLVLRTARFALRL